MDELYRILALVMGYTFGCVQFAFFISKMQGVNDIREHGSGNAGMTNVTRVLGFKVGGLVFALDILKAVAAFSLAVLVFGRNCNCCIGGYNYLPGLYAGLGAIIGHNFPFYMGFRGGKGVACMIGLIIVFDWRVALVCFLIPLMFFLATRFISVGSLAVAAVFPLSMAVFRYVFDFGFAVNYNLEHIGIAVVVAVLCWVMHIGNIKKIIAGTESKFSFRRKKTEET
jgi:glycerol-3-phosphate acyltransferase PlsY